MIKAMTPLTRLRAGRMAFSKVAGPLQRLTVGHPGWEGRGATTPRHPGDEGLPRFCGVQDRPTSASCTAEAELGVTSGTAPEEQARASPTLIRVPSSSRLARGGR